MRQLIVSYVVAVLSLLLPLRAIAQEARSDTAAKPAAAAATVAPQEPLAGLDDFIAEVMKEWQIPGLAIAVVQDGKVVHTKGYGYRDIEKQLPVTTQTIFAIGSITKSFTVTGLGMLVDEGQLDWDRPVRQYLPDFQLHDRIATEQTTARDLVIHRSGLPRHDLVWYADPKVSRGDLYQRLRFLEPSKEFRSTWQYQNLMYLTAGIMAERISGKSWEDFTRERIIDPLGMQYTNFSVTESQKSDDFARPYTKNKDEVKPIPFHNIDSVGPAGSINSNVDAMIRYVQLHIAKGKHADQQLLSATQAEQMQTPQMVMPPNSQSSAGEEFSDMSYGMGLMVSSYRGTKYVEHGGGIDGFISLMTFLPRKKVGVIVLTNLSGVNPTPMIVSRRVHDLLLGLEPVDWAGRVRTQQKQAKAVADAAKKQSDSARKEGTSPSHGLADYAGSYQHPAYGVVQIEHDGSSLSVTTPSGQSASLHHYHFDIFETAEDPTGRFDKRKLTFLYNRQGDIDRVTIPFEPAVGDIVFTRLPDKSLQQKDVLETLAGQYQLGLTTITVALKNDTTLAVTVPGQPSYELVPTRNFSFDIKGLKGFAVSFRKDSSGSIAEVVFVQPNGTFAAKRKTDVASAAATRTGSEPASPAESVKSTASTTSTPEPKKTDGSWTPDRMMQLRRVGHVRPSPDGSRVVYTVTTPVMTKEKSENVTQIHMARADGTESVQLTYHEKSSTDPHWSPDGQMLAFLSDRAGKNNLYVLRTSGGEAEQLTDSNGGVNSFAWSPDGRQIACTMTDPPTADDERAKAKADWRWVDEDPKLSRLFVVPISKDAHGHREPRQLTKAAFHVAVLSRAGAAELDWSPDGKSIVFTHRKSPKADHWTTSDLSVVQVDSGDIRPLAATNASEFGAVYSPDGKQIAFVMSDDPPTWAGSYAIQLVPADGGTVRSLPATYDHQPGLVGWSNDGSRLFFVEARGTVNRLSSVQVANGEFEDLNQGSELIRSVELNRMRTMFGFTLESPQQAPEAFVSGVERIKPVAISRVNTELSKEPLGKVEVVRWKSFDGMEIEGILTYPIGYEPGKRVPLLLQVHGGPMGVFLQGYGATPSLYPNAVFAARGCAILQPNPRGSSGYGKSFRYANYKDWGGGDYRDLMAGVDHVITMGVADPDRLGVMGWSYGGYMTSWTITQTRRFKAASVGAAVTNLLSFTGTADIPSFLPDYLGAQPWENSEIYRGRSAVLQAKGVTTPTLVQHGEADVRVPVSQGYEFFNAIVQQGVPARMLVLPRQPHGPNEPKMMLKILETNLEWFDKYLGLSSREPAGTASGGD